MAAHFAVIPSGAKRSRGRNAARRAGEAGFSILGRKLAVTLRDPSTSLGMTENEHLKLLRLVSSRIDKPEQDLSPRIIDALKESPGAFLGLIFRQVGEWLKDALGD